MAWEVAVDRFGSARAPSLLWNVRSRSGRMGFHMLGTAHTACHPPWMLRVETILSASEWIAVECVPGLQPTNAPRLPQVLVSTAIAGNDEAFERVTRASWRMGLLPSRVVALPLMDAWKLLLAAASVREAWSDTVDAHLLRAAARARVRVVPLEGVHDVFRRLEQVEPAIQLEAFLGLTDVLRASREAELVAAKEALKRSYTAGLFDEKYMALTVRPGFPEEVVQILVEERDAAFASAILEIARSGPGLVAVGAGHLAGVLARLEGSGFDIAPLALCGDG